MENELALLPISLITQCSELTLTNEKGHELDLFKQMRGVVDQICVVYQDSWDNSLPLILEYADDVLFADCLHHPECFRNDLLAMARNEWCLFLDADMKIDGDAHKVLKYRIEEQGKDYDAFAFVNVNLLDGKPWGPEILAGTQLGSHYLFRKECCLGQPQPPLLHTPLQFKAETRFAPQTNLKIIHRSTRPATERWKLYYRYLTHKLSAMHADNPDALDLLRRVHRCHWEMDSTSMARGTHFQTVNIEDGVKVAFLGGVAENQTWPFISYDSKEGAHVVIYGDARLDYSPRFVERALECFALIPESLAVCPRFIGAIPEGMTAVDVENASTLLLAGIKPTTEYFSAPQKYYMNKVLVQGVML